MKLQKNSVMRLRNGIGNEAESAILLCVHQRPVYMRRMHKNKESGCSLWHHGRHNEKPSTTAHNNLFIYSMVML